MIIDDPSRWEVIDEDPPGLCGSLVEDPSANDMVSLEVSLYRTRYGSDTIWNGMMLACDSSMIHGKCDASSIGVATACGCTVRA
ncbi:hypothetical protein L6164_005575 [Bauhinia variegata]|uniref:Uncharacterized protein n=1 Tax=Bauhinia variegata TaxID=167791 RepID=A0ACB9PUC4_BAUVA|nr:hypothetical protein L6164_005575 [Bauhinia variegata]